MDECLRLAADARRLMTGEAADDDVDAAVPPATPALEDLAGSLARVLGEIGRSMRTG